jgi:hypothetical protein
MNVSAAVRSIGMRRRLGGGRRAVFEKSDGRDAGEIGDLGGHVRLVGVPSIERQRDERRRRQRLEATEARYAREHLRPVADRVADASLELPGTQAQLGGDRRDACLRTVERGDRGANQGIETRREPALDGRKMS